MKLVALLPFYAEEPVWLGECVQSLALARVDYLVAADGAYQEFPFAHDRPASTPLERNAIQEAAIQCGIELTLHMRYKPYFGGEIEKRNLLFDLARQAWDLTSRDWYLLIDSDEYIEHASPDLKERLNVANADTACYELHNEHDTSAIRGLYRNQPGLCVRHSHYGYHNAAGDYLFDGGTTPADDLTHHLQLRHRHHERSDERKAHAAAYYAIRDNMQLDRHPLAIT